MKTTGSQFGRIKNLPRIELPKHFSFSTLSAAVLAVFFAGALAAQTFLGPGLTANEVTMLAGAVVGSAVVLVFLPLWPVAFAMIIALWAGMQFHVETDLVAALIPMSLGLLVAPCFQIVDQWDKVVILRLGRFKRVFGPGPYVLFPVIDTVARFVDMRIRATDFSAEKSLSKDTVPVHVDALAFWMIWDAQKAILEVENYVDAVTLSAQTALRDSIGKNDLATLLSERERLGSEIQSVLDAKTSPWGITILSIEFTEVLIPKELEDALSKQAQAERERQSRIILGSAEVEIAKKFEEASERYKDNPTAFQLRAMNMIYDSIRTHGSMVLVPSSAVDSMSLGSTMGAAALQKIQAAENAGTPATATLENDQLADGDSPSE